jgi:DNA-binding transcriptional LysR family regulator
MDLGVPLFERQGRSVKLNRYGKMFIKKVNQALATIKEGQQELEEALNPETGNIALAFLHTLGSDLVPELIGEYRAQHPAVTFQLFQNTAEMIMEQLVVGEMDLCLTTVDKVLPGIRWVELFSEEVFVIVPKSHKLAKEDQVALKDLANESFIGFKEGVGMRTITNNLCQQAGFSPNLTFEGQEVGTVTGLVSAGLGVSIIPKRRGIDQYEVKFLPIIDVNGSRTIGIAWKEGDFTPKVVEQFRDYVLEHF